MESAEPVDRVVDLFQKTYLRKNQSYEGIILPRAGKVTINIFLTGKSILYDLLRLAGADDIRPYGPRGSLFGFQGTIANSLFCTPTARIAV